MAQYLIGDVQGCYDPLLRLLKKIRFDSTRDRLIFCGDVVSRGGYSLEVLRLLYSMREQVVVTLGNHDFHLLFEDMKFPDGNSRIGEFRKILQAIDRRALIEWLTSQRLAYFMPNHNVLALHAGVIPQWTIQATLDHAAEVEAVLASSKREKFLARLFSDRRRLWSDKLKGMKRRAMITHILTRIRYCDANGKLNYSAAGPPGSQPAGFQPWFKHKHRATREVRVAFGHWASLGLRVKKRYVALDSGCVWGGKLTAWRAEDGKLFQVPANKKPGKKKPGKSKKSQ